MYYIILSILEPQERDHHLNEVGVSINEGSVFGDIFKKDCSASGFILEPFFPTPHILMALELPTARSAWHGSRRQHIMQKPESPFACTTLVHRCKFPSKYNLP